MRSERDCRAGGFVRRRDDRSYDAMQTLRADFPEAFSFRKRFSSGVRSTIAKSSKAVGYLKGAVEDSNFCRSLAIQYL